MGYDIEKEKREAIEAGQRALSSLRTAKENLNSAKNWGLVDMFGGGFFSTMFKHSKMDQARQNMEQAKYDLRSFSKGSGTVLIDMIYLTSGICDGYFLFKIRQYFLCTF